MSNSSHKSLLETLHKTLRILAAVIFLPALIGMGFNCYAGPAAKNAKAGKKIKVETPDFDRIERITHDPKSEFYFPKLMKLYERNDTAMTPEQYRNLYLGYLFQEDYDPYRTSEYNAKTDSIMEIVEAQKTRLTAMNDSLAKLVKAEKISGHEAENKIKMVKNAYNRELRELALVTELSLKDNPFDLRQMSILVHASKEMGNAMKAKIWEYRLENILGAIKSTGSGEDMKNAFYVIYPMHEYNMIQLMGYEPTAVDFPEEGFDYISVQPDTDSGIKIRNPHKGFYFNVDRLTEQYELKHPDADNGDVDAESAEGVVSADDVPAE